MFLNKNPWALVGAFFLVVASCASSPENTSEKGAASDEQSEKPALSEAAQRIKGHITYLASDALKGREAGTPEYDLAADYVAKEFGKLGLTPAGDNGSWFQDVPLRSVRRDLDKAHMSIKRDGSDIEFEHFQDYLIGLPAGGTFQEITAEMVFVGYGLYAPQFGIDDYAGLNVRNKIVVVLLGSSADLPSEEAAHFNSARTRRETAAAKGAIGMIGVYDSAFARRLPWERMIRNPERASMTWVTPEGLDFTAAPEIRVNATVSKEGGEKLFDGSEMSYADILATTEDKKERVTGFELEGKVTIRAGSISEASSSPNVVAMIPGADPKLRDEYVVLSAHLDHTGYGKNSDPEVDTINNGALDNASGIATMLEAAQMLANGEAAPRRSIVFTAVTAEEKGLIGSEYFAHYPTVKNGPMVANVNLDMPLIIYPFTDVIAFGADHSSLGETVRTAAAKMNVELIPDPIPQLSIFTRSDHYRFVQQGIPSVFLFLGFGNGGEQAFNDFMSNRYHRPGDDLTQPLDYEQGARFAKLNYLVTEAIANDDERPTWNEGDFFGDLFAKD